jgi:hypothetical protein
MKIRLDILKESLKARLAKKSTAVELIQTDPCSIMVKYGGHENELNFPFLVNVARCTVRASRKLSYIEVKCNINALSIYYHIANAIVKVLVPP